MTDDTTRSDKSKITPEFQEAALRYFQDLFANRCPICHEPAIGERRIGRSVYAEPCGHRMYQGKVGAFHVSDK